MTPWFDASLGRAPAHEQDGPGGSRVVTMALFPTSSVLVQKHLSTVAEWGDHA